MTYALIVGGLPAAAFDRLKKISENRIAPGGKVFSRPNSSRGKYDPGHASHLIQSAKDYLKARPDGERVNICLIYVDYGELSTKRFVNTFFPFALPAPIQPVELDDVSLTKRERNEALNRLAANLISTSDTLRGKARLVSENTHIANLTPLLLPRKNFGGRALVHMLEHLSGALPGAEDVPALIKAAVADFFRSHPLTYPESKGHYGQRHCFSDGNLFFKSPARNRHGYLRNRDADKHAPGCLLNARSRLGGSYDHTFHYDCEPCKGASLAASYPNCHDEATSPKERHINVAPNDYII